MTGYSCIKSWQAAGPICADTIVICSCPTGRGAHSAEDKGIEKQQIARTLVQTLMPGRPAHQVKVVLTADSIGRPLISVPGISISFSTCGASIHGAAAATMRLGIDAASASEFAGNYPFKRVFHKDELALIQSFGHSLGETAALLWASKEAVVKAMGTGFRNIEPLDIRITACRLFAGNYTVEVETEGNYAVNINRLSDQWLAVAV